MAQSLIEDAQVYQILERKIAALNRQRGIVERLHRHALEARKEAAQEILDSVSSVANTLHEQIHPGENIASLNLAVRTAVERSINLSTHLYGTDEHPLLHYSESHLDTLGLCYFLAVRRREAAQNERFKVLILDDVLHSVDADHRDRIAKLLKREFTDHQIIIATHDWHFFERLRAALGTNDFKYLAVTDWDIERGPITSDPSTDLDRILSKEQRETKGHEELVGAGGRLFEWMLKQLTERLEVAVRARFERKQDIGNLWPPLCSKLRRHASFTGAHPTLAGDLSNSTWVRNACGAHHNETASAVTPGEVREFADLLAALYSATHCDDCGAFNAKKDNDDWRCDCATITYPRKA